MFPISMHQFRAIPKLCRLLPIVKNQYGACFFIHRNLQTRTDYRVFFYHTLQYTYNFFFQFSVLFLYGLDIPRIFFPLPALIFLDFSAIMGMIKCSEMHSILLNELDLNKRTSQGGLYIRHLSIIHSKSFIFVVFF